MWLADNLLQNSKSSQEGPKAAVCEGAAGNAAGAALRSHEPRHPGSRCIGRPRPGLEIRLVDDDDRDVPEGSAGQALVRQAGPSPRAGFFSGYLNDQEATEQAWPMTVAWLKKYAS